MLSRHLNVPEVDIDSISKEHHGDLREAALKALLQYGFHCVIYSCTMLSFNQLWTLPP